ncbi:MAG: shikimate dehydrogenase, partial [Chloroflexi bacterium]|nr:shikimate dehydrogenase [Chloroflexota bacterium]
MVSDRAHMVYDIINNPPKTRLVKAAEERGCRVLGGLPMLVMQGALAFQLWTGREAPADVMREAAERAVANWK